MRRPRVRATIALGVAIGVIAGCASVDTSVRVANAHITSAPTTTATTAPSDSTITAAPDTTPPTDVITTAPLPSDASSSFSGLAYEDVVPLAITAIDTFWTKELPARYGTTYKTLTGGVHGLKPGQQAAGCHSSVTTYTDVADNAFYCPDGDFMVYDNAELFPQLYTRFGPFVIAIVVAHEWGHAIQIRAGLDPNSSVAQITIENQADCFAGAWTRWLADGGKPGVEVSPRDVDSSLSGLLFFRDDPGVTSAQQGAHGSGFDRVTAFQDGYANGTKQCATYLTNPPQPLDLQFTSSDFATGGNAPYTELMSFMPQALDRYWAEQFTKRTVTFAPLAARLHLIDAKTAPLVCGAKPVAKVAIVGTDYYCSADDYLAFDEPALLRLPYQRIGDFATAIVLAQAWARAGLARLHSTLDKTKSDHAVDCAAGAFTGAVYRGSATDSTGQPITLSPGDLDEAISELIGDSRSVPGSAFTRVASFRIGFFQGVSACGIG